jgi:hypothetical protein
VKQMNKVYFSLYEREIVRHLKLDIKEYPDLPGVKSYYLNVLPDERGFFMEAMRTDWKELFGDDQIVQANMSYSYPGRETNSAVPFWTLLFLSSRISLCHSGESISSSSLSNEFQRASIV